MTTISESTIEELEKKQKEKEAEAKRAKELETRAKKAEKGAKRADKKAERSAFKAKRADFAGKARKLALAEGYPINRVIVVSKGRDGPVVKGAYRPASVLEAQASKSRANDDPKYTKKTLDGFEIVRIYEGNDGYYVHARNGNGLKSNIWGMHYNPNTGVYREQLVNLTADEIRDYAGGMVIVYESAGTSVKKAPKAKKANQRGVHTTKAPTKKVAGSSKSSSKKGGSKGRKR